MSQPGSVIVGYDGSPDAKRALAWGTGFARSTGASVRVLLATGDMRLRQVTEHDQDWERSRIAEVTADARAAVSGAPLDDAALDIVEAALAPALIVPADPTAVIIPGSRGHGRFSAAVIGSVSQHVAAHAPCTVIVVR